MASRSENDVDGETVDCGLTESMVGYLFDGSFKKQIKFQQFVWQYKEGETIITLQQVPLEVNESTTQLQPQPFTSPSHEPAHKRLPAVVIIPAFPKDVQMTLNAQERCHIVPRLRNNIIRVLYKMMAEYTLYPTNAEYVQVSKALIAKYPFLRDVAGNSYCLKLDPNLDSAPAKSSAPSAPPAPSARHERTPGPPDMNWEPAAGMSSAPPAFLRHPPPVVRREFHPGRGRARRSLVVESLNTPPPYATVSHSPHHTRSNSVYNFQAPMVEVAGSEGRVQLVYRPWTYSDMKDAAASPPDVRNGGVEFAVQLITFCRQFKPTTAELQRLLMVQMGSTRA
ncbi:uncharacterized protein LOC119023134 isoform X4 [Acanthopagrus latus]|uniref:uncharacterized protein LOC119023134 isoform X4 n=1 Tax=Acanthopagrus latus TaxID=8177 RepID=UPI00187C554A|nr:uncharacterized protein LOC119023134 isoform X4 [Acanthopagrus latus]